MSRTNKFTAALLTGLLWLFSGVPLYAQEITVAVPLLPSFKGVPYGRPWGGNPDAFTLPAIFEGLTYLNGDGEAQPLLATSWERLGDTRWRFTLREGVRFSNGAPFNAETVQQNLSFIHEAQSAAYSVVRQVAHIARINAPGPHILDVITTYPDPFLPNLMSVVYMVEPGQWNALGSIGFSNEPVGTGPYEVTDWAATTVSLKASAMAWRQAESNTLKIIEVPETTTRLQGLLSGDLDVIFSMGPDDRTVIESAGHRIMVRATPGVVTLPFNLGVESPLQDVRVRRALNHAVDNATIVKAILGDEAVVPTQFASHMAFGFEPGYAPYPYDVERARALMAEAGYAGGFDLPVEVTRGLSSYSTSIYQLVAVYLREIGVNMEIRSVPIPRYAAILMQGQWRNTLAINLDYAVDPTMDALMPIDRHSCSGAITWYCDREIEPLLAAARSTLDLDQRLALTHRAVRRQTEQAPGLLLWEKIRYDAASSRVEGFIHEMNYILFDKLRLAD